MDEYIKREDAISAVCFGCNLEFSDSHCEPSDCEIRHAINAVPAADVVEVVRCKDCAVLHNKWLGCPSLNGEIPPPDFYCARGERKSDNGSNSTGH